MTIPIPLPNKANTYEIHFHPTFWKEVRGIVAGLKKYISGALYWVGPSKEVKEAETVIGFYSKRILEEDTLGPVRMSIWLRGKLDLDAIKAILDGCQLGGRIKNDKQVEELHVYRLKGKNESFDLDIEKTTVVMEEDCPNGSSLDLSNEKRMRAKAHGNPP